MKVKGKQIKDVTFWNKCQRCCLTSNFLSHQVKKVTFYLESFNRRTSAEFFKHGGGLRYGDADRY